MILTHATIISTIMLTLTAVLDGTAQADGYCGPLGTSQSFEELNKTTSNTLKDIRVDDDKKEFARILYSLINKFGVPPIMPDRIMFHKLNTGSTTVSVHANGCAMAWFVLDKASVTELLGDPV